MTHDNIKQQIERLKQQNLVIDNDFQREVARLEAFHAGRRNHIEAELTYYNSLLSTTEDEKNQRKK